MRQQLLDEICRAGHAVAHKCKIGWECTKKLAVNTVWNEVEKWTQDKVEMTADKR